MRTVMSEPLHPNVDRRDLLRVLAFGAAATTATAAQLPPAAADSATESSRRKARYQADSPEVQTFYRVPAATSNVTRSQSARSQSAIASGIPTMAYHRSVAADWASTCNGACEHCCPGGAAGVSARSGNIPA
jgi:hypothetical protein